MSFPRRGNLFRVIYWVIIHGMGEVEEERVLLLSEEKTISIGGIFQRQHPLRFFPKDGETLSRVISYHIFFLLNWRPPRLYKEDAFHLCNHEGER